MTGKGGNVYYLRLPAFVLSGRSIERIITNENRFLFRPTSVSTVVKDKWFSHFSVAFTYDTTYLSKNLILILFFINITSN